MSHNIFTGVQHQWIRAKISKRTILRNWCPYSIMRFRNNVVISFKIDGTIDGDSINKSMFVYISVYRGASVKKTGRNRLT